MQKTQEQLGEVLIPSGLVLIVDMGLLDLWSHDRAPLIADGILSEAMTDSVNNGADFQIEGPDAESAGRAFNRQWHPHFLYDIPAHAIPEVRSSFESVMSESGLNATLHSLRPRISHRQRVDHALQFGRGAGEVIFHGISAIALDIGPQTKPLPVVGFRMEGSEFPEQWHEVHLLVREESAPVITSKLVGHASVDKARLMFIDVDALALWKHEDPLDGMADFVFWGRDAESAAKTFHAAQLGDDKYGWQDMPVMDVVELGVAFEEYVNEAQLKIATDFRPHSHHYFAMEQVRSSETQSGVVDLGNARACAFMTTWGDGIFPVFNDVDENGRTLRLRVELGNETSMEAMRSVNQ